MQASILLMKNSREALMWDSGQYLYLAVNDCWIPVVIRYSPRSHGWVFQNLENIDIDGQKVMMK